MTTYIQTVRSRALAGRAAEFRDWYLETHIPDMLRLPGFVSADLLRSLGADNAPAEFLCIYTIETADLAAVQAAMLAAGATTVPSPAMDLPATRVEFFEQAAA